jgi:glycosyltransferase involved in cell wall biosynthesis
MPCYNNVDDIGAAIESVIQQTLSSWELIIVDDASTDGTPDYVQNTYKDPRIFLHKMNVNAGSGPCRNFAISQSRGEYIAVLDADDECLPERLRRQVELFDSDPSTDVVASQVLEFGDWGGPVLGNWPTTEAGVRRRQMANKMPVAHPSVMFKKSCLEAVGGYDPACRRAQDFALFLKLKNAQIKCINEPLIKYRTDRPISFSYAVRNEMYADLALRRHDLRSQGVPDAQLPNVPIRKFFIYRQGFRNWTVRRIKEIRAVFTEQKMYRS